MLSVQGERRAKLDFNSPVRILTRESGEGFHDSLVASSGVEFDEFGRVLDHLAELVSAL